jgi:hypothetical protein
MTSAFHPMEANMGRAPINPIDDPAPDPHNPNPIEPPDEPGPMPDEPNVPPQPVPPSIDGDEQHG